MTCLYGFNHAKVAIKHIMVSRIMYCIFSIIPLCFMEDAEDNTIAQPVFPSGACALYCFISALSYHDNPYWDSDGTYNSILLKPI